MEEIKRLLKEKNEIDYKVILNKAKIISMRNIAMEMLESGKLSLFLASWLKTELIKQNPNLHATSIPIEVISSELDKMSNSFPEKAYETFEGLNSLLIDNETWKENAPKIRNRILENKQKFTTQVTYSYASGATHNDYSKHISFTNKEKQIE